MSGFLMAGGRGKWEGGKEGEGKERRGVSHCEEGRDGGIDGELNTCGSERGSREIQRGVYVIHMNMYYMVRGWRRERGGERDLVGE